MAKRLQLTIPEPCHENWDAMTPVEKGRFCNACQKQVTDFTHMSDRQLAEFFKKPSTGSGCGRFLNTQLERDIEIPRKRIPWLKYFFTVALPAFLLSLKPGSVKAQGQVWVKANETTEKPVCSLTPEVKTAQTDTARFLAEGVVVDQAGQALPGVAVRVKGTRTGMATQIDGSFKIMVKKGDVLVVNGVGLETTETTIKNTDRITIILHSNIKVGQEIVLIAGGYFYSSYIKPIRKITGFVIDEQGKPLQGVWVTGKKRKIIATTDEKGKFSIQVDRKDILLFSNPGFDKQELKTGKSDTVYVKMGKGMEPENKTAVQNFFELKLYPNPVRSGAPVTFDFNVSPVKGTYQWILQNTSGQVVHQAPLKLSGYEEKISLNMPNVLPGNYFLVLLDPVSSTRYSQPIVVVR